MEYRGDHEPNRAEQQHGRSQPSGGAIEALNREAQPADERRCAEDEQDVADDRTGERRLDQVRESLAERHHTDDELGGVPERRVQQAADAAAEVLREDFSRVADERRKRQDRERRRKKDRDVALGGEDPQENRHGHEEEQDDERARDAFSHTTTASFPHSGLRTVATATRRRSMSGSTNRADRVNRRARVSSG